MRRIVPGLFLAGVAILSLLWGGAGVALAEEDLDANRRELAALERQIDETLQMLRGKRAAAGSLAADLERLEQSLEQVRGLARRSDRELTEVDRRLTDRQADLERLRGQQSTTEQQLKKRLTALYKIGQVGIARALLSAVGTPLELAEKYAFLSRIVRHDRQMMADYRQQALAAKAALNDLQQLRERQAAVAVQHRAAQAALDSAGQAKKQLLAGLRTDEAKLATAVDELRAKAARLAELVKKLETTQTQSYTGTGADFPSQKGRLKWPANGKVRTGFGTTRHPELGTLIESNGLEIAVPPQAPVRSVWAGRVLYAGPLKGFGNLMVIDHGDKYYTLYAHAARFTRKVGDAVNADEVIAFSGHDGRDAVYFEIRHRGSPVDPAQWLASR